MTAASGRGDAFEAPLDADLLIEASAGTGKTYALTTLVARLIVEQRRRIDELLIVTFTISAAGELRTRVRRTLQAAREAASGSAAAPDHQARRLREGWRSLGIPDAEALDRLVQAVRDFDRANITTIHGFCQRTLVEFALPARIPFSFGISGNDLQAVGAAVRDFWRRRMVNEPIALLEYAKLKSFVPDEDSTAWVGGQQSRQYEVRGLGGPGDCRADAENPGSEGGQDTGGSFARTLQSRREEWLKALRDAHAAWSDPEQQAEFQEIANPMRWKKQHRAGVQARAAMITRAFDVGDQENLAPNLVGGFGAKALQAGLLTRNPAPPTSLFRCFERVGAVGSEYAELRLAGPRREQLADVRDAQHHGAWSDRRLSFDALLVELHRALTGDQGAALARRIRSRFPVALIDEFQDTDRLQAEIFTKIHPGSDGAADGRLFVVGDPKQSIYRFRGADVFAYLEAKKRLGAGGPPLSLDHNYRSSPGLIRAVNELFSRPAPFVLSAFDFAACEPAERDRAELVVQDDRDDRRPFQFVLLPRRDRKKRNKGDLTQLAASQAASEIARLLEMGKEGRATVRGGSGREDREALTGGDIAVLVRKGAQGKAIAEALRTLGVDSVELGIDNIFDSDEAKALYRLLHALCIDEAEFSATPLLRGALAADLFGLDMQELAKLRDDDDVWDHWRGLAREWSRVWRDRGIATLMRRILFAGEPDCSANLLRYPNGPRRLTNYLHLGDLLHAAETRNRPSRRGLLDWFRQSRAEPQLGDETAQLRLESDENLVKIVTVHRAKGLEFPIVFYPFAWDGHRPKRGRQKRPTAEFYDPERATPVLDLQPSDEAYDRERIEEHADEMRLLYVALTRAQYRCVVTWAPDGQSEHAPMAWLLYDDDDPGEDPGEDAAKDAEEDPGEDASENGARALDRHAERVKALDAGEWQAGIRRFQNRAPDAISIRTGETEPPSPRRPDDDAKVQDLEVRVLGRKLALIRQQTSYSALATGAGVSVPAPDDDAVDLPDHDEATDVDEADTESVSPPEKGPTIFTFPGGGRTGRCLHEIFERYLGDADSADLEQICQAVLSRYGFQEMWQPVARTLVTNALATPLASPGETDSVFRLSDLEQPITELEFHLPLRAFRRRALARCLEAHGYDDGLDDDEAAVEGFLHGYIDLVARHDGRWYVIDYKSNWLGPDLSAYSDAMISRSMRQHHYRLQYLLYLTALHRLLRVRLEDYDYDRHMGGAFYLFLRGMRPHAPGSGVFRDRPPLSCIEAIDACFNETT